MQNLLPATLRARFAWHQPDAERVGCMRPQQQLAAQQRLPAKGGARGTPHSTGPAEVAPWGSRR